MNKLYTILYKVLMTSFAALAMAGCSSSWEDDMAISGNGFSSSTTARVETEEKRKVLLLYSAGYNDLRSYLQEDIEELKEGTLPQDRRNDDIVLVYTHASKTDQDYVTPTTPYLIRLYSDIDGSVICDTLVTYPDNTISSSALQLNKVLTYVRDNFHARSYGMIFSSHATGFLPSGYYSKPSSYVFQENRMKHLRYGHTHLPTPVEIIEREHDPSLPMVKSAGADYGREDSRLIAYEMELREFANAIPMKLDYILFDSCLMGGVEVAYELREKCNHIMASQAEVLAWGINYRTLTTHLFGRTSPDIHAICEDYIEQYMNMSGASRSATISMISTAGLEDLASVCAPLFAKYRDNIQELSYNRTQGYGGTKYYFFDLVDVVRCAGATDEELQELQDAVDNVVPYKSTTGQYYSETDRDVHPIDPDKFSGLTMYVPRIRVSELDKYYRTLSWNQATELVKY